MIQILPEERWEELREVFATEFNSALPDKGRANIVADIDEDGKINGFIMTEVLLRVCMPYKTGKMTRQMLQWLENNIPTGAAVVVIASSERFEGLCEKFGMREIEGKVYRRDF